MGKDLLYDNRSYKTATMRLCGIKTLNSEHNSQDF